VRPEIVPLRPKCTGFYGWNGFGKRRVLYGYRYSVGERVYSEYSMLFPSLSASF
jgi:hypothetical protein